MQSTVDLKFALTQFTYDAVEEVMSVVVTTVVDWPNMLTDADMAVTLPSNQFQLGNTLFPPPLSLLFHLSPLFLPPLSR